MSKKVTPRQHKTIEALLTSGDRRAACAAAGISAQTLYRWLKQPHFRQALQQAEGEALQALQRRLTALGDMAVGVLGDTMSDPQARPSERLRAADVTLSRLLQLREMVALEERVAELERRTEGLP